MVDPGAGSGDGRCAGRAGRGAGLGRDHVHRLAEPDRRPVRRRRPCGRGHRDPPVRHRRHERLHPPPGRAGQRGRHRAGDVRRPVRPRHRPGRHRPVPPGPQADAGGPVRRAGHRRAGLPGRRHGRLRRAPEPDAVARPGPPAQGAARRGRLRAPDDRLRGPHRRAGHVRRRCRPRPPGLGPRPGPQGRGRRGAHPVVRGLRHRRLPPRPGGRARPDRRLGRRLRPLLVDAGLDRRRPGRGRQGDGRRGGPALRQQRAPQQPGRPRRCPRARVRRPLRHRRAAGGVRGPVRRPGRAGHRPLRRDRPGLRRRPRPRPQRPPAAGPRAAARPTRTRDP